ncbi:MAG: hypothetical protein COU63_05010 [Candidatus Pacebacteria bacterium CG10_big_fil_rev_8_21_14_0_10_36_11]|nr:O-antigen ligase family protein [Candidatus Pacearchaeota archaeon]OIP73831.1 MAG: hypothetical protein AUK08_04720 [Candidatus Pacebacteria bacterium CG2_30_36_39]PIR64297.1 MAG: hypothetical protein COU63_05010 [Candidatus Pacebacteria bacterium CG10_big_fil_rev_8_21_14_0_10_36_11]
MLQKIKQFLASLIKPTDQMAVIATFLFCAMVFLIPSVKIYFVVSFFYFIFLAFYYSFPRAVIYSVPIFLSLTVGQIYAFPVMSAADIGSIQYWEGRQLLFILSPHLVILFAAGLLLPFYYFKSRIKLLTYEKILLILPFIFIFSSFWIAPFPFLSTIFSLRESLILIWFMYLLIATANLKVQRNKVLATLILILLVTLSFENFLVFAQLIKNSALGLMIEKAEIIPVFGLGSDEQGGGFRPFGWHPHANSLANEQLMMALGALVFVNYLKNVFSKEANKIIYLLIIGILVFVTFISLSRSAFLAFIVSCGFYSFYYFRDKNIFSFIKKINVEVKKINPWIKLIFLFASSVLIFKMSYRLFNSFSSFSPTGGVTTRISQTQEAFGVLGKSPFLGFGSGMFIPVSFELFPEGIMKYFPEEIHNGFILFLVERGLVAGVFCLVFFGLLLKKVRKILFSPLALAMIYSSIAAGFIMMLFHPFINLFSFNILAILLVLHYEKTTS